MSIAALGKLAVLGLLGLSLSACVDANLDVALTSETTATASLTQVMRQDSFTTVSLVDTMAEARYQAGIQAVADAEAAIVDTKAAGKDASKITVPPAPEPYQPLATRFCVNGRLLERVDGGATCLDTSEGAFDEIYLGDLTQPITFTTQEDGQVRIALQTRQLVDAVTPEIEVDHEIETAIPALFAGRKIVIRFSGGEVTETNMTLAKDETSASQEIQLLDLIAGTAKLPEEFYAVVRAP